MRTLIMCITVFSFVCGNTLSQWSSDPAETFEEAYEYFFFGEYSEALPLLLSLLRSDPGNSNLNYLAGVCYFNTDGQRQRALSFLEVASKNISFDYIEESFEEKRAPVDCLWYLGIAYRLAFRFEESLESFDRLTGLLETSYDIREILREREITEDARMFYLNERMINREVDVELPLSFTFQKNIVISGDESVIAYSEPQKFYDAVFVTRKSDDGWSRPANITTQLGSDGLAYPVSLSWDGTELYLYQYDRLANTNLYVSNRQNNRWSQMKKLDGNINSAGYEQHASITKDGRSLYFSSNRLSGQGGFDIYRSERDSNNEWGPAENLGHPVNTSFNESYPSISPDGRKLIFSSTGHRGMGGYDIFISNLQDDGTWSTPRNPGYPLNTPDNDAFLVPVGEGTVAYANLRKAENTDQREFIVVGIPDVEPYPTSSLFVNILPVCPYEKDSLPVAITIARKHPSDTILTDHIMPGRKTGYKLPWGDYRIELLSDIYQTESVPLSIPEYFAEEEYHVEVTMSCIQPPVPELIPVIIETEPLLFGFDRYDLDQKAMDITLGIARILTEYSGITVEVKGYTDAVGPASYNLGLAQRRASAVADALAAGGVEESRITINAVGMKDYLARNTTEHGRDNPEGRKYNRRVQFVLSNLPVHISQKEQSIIPEHLKKQID
jgi:outer membrane protein OmpA-like peptidoglycan-associated protein/tetratricopeptide (TPR) repeat protein